MHAREGCGEGGRVCEVASDDGDFFRKSLCCVRGDISGDGADGVFFGEGWVVEDVVDDGAALDAGGTEYREDFGHDDEIVIIEKKLLMIIIVIKTGFTVFIYMIFYLVCSDIESDRVIKHADLVRPHLRLASPTWKSPVARLR